VVISGALVADIPAPVFIIQGERFVYLNRALAALFALPETELLGRSCVDRVHPDDRSVFPGQPGATASAAGAPASNQVRVRCGDGAERSLVLTTVPIVHDEAPALLGVAADVSLQPDALTVAVRMAALGRLAGGVAHDYNNLLLVMGGHIERLQRQLPAESELRPDVEAIAAAAIRAGTLTDNLLSFGRRQLLAPEVQDLGVVVQAVAAELRSSLEPALDLRVQRGASVPAIEADTHRLREVLWHLVENARDAMPDGGTLTMAVDAIEVDAALQSRWAFLTRGGVFVRLRVIDTGSGMDPAVAAHVFEPFFTTKGKGRGAGMGLASVYGIVKQSGGFVFAERAGQAGTCMTVLLPPATARQHAASPVRRASQSPPTAGEGRNRILLVEDDPGVREVLQDVLRSHGFDVHAAATAEEAQTQAAGQMFDLLLSDVDLPGMNGARLAAGLLASQPGLRVILMSGYPDDGTIDGELDTRPMFLNKPFTSAVLLESVRKAFSSGGA
jgi:PAS domain S-box-containing protein